MKIDKKCPILAKSDSTNVEYQSITPSEAGWNYLNFKAKKLKAYKIGKEFRIDKNEFENFLDKVKTK